MNATIHAHAARRAVEMSRVSHKENAAVTELLKAPLMQGVEISAADGGVCCSRRDPGNVISCHRVAQGGFHVLSGLG